MTSGPGLTEASWWCTCVTRGQERLPQARQSGPRSGTASARARRTPSASMFSGRAKGARTALLDGLARLVWAQGGTTRVAFDFTVAVGKVARSEMIADADVLDEMVIEFLRRGTSP